MAGFPGTDSFTLHPKCLVFAAAVGLLYWFLPPRNIYILVLLLIAAYMSMAWYDYVYGIVPSQNLRRRNKSKTFSFS